MYVSIYHRSRCSMKKISTSFNRASILLRRSILFYNSTYILISVFFFFFLRINLRYHKYIIHTYITICPIQYLQISNSVNEHKFINPLAIIEQHMYRYKEIIAYSSFLRLNLVEEEQDCIDLFL